MTWKKRLRVLWAALRQEWHEHTCVGCGVSHWIEGRRLWTEPTHCGPCEGKQYDAWVDQMEQNRTKGAA